MNVMGGLHVLGGDREIYCLNVSIMPEETIKIYPFTSRVLKSIAIQKILRSHRDLILSRDKYKPLFISMLSDGNGRRLYSLYNSKPQILVEGMVYRGRICISPRGGASIDPELEGFVETPFGRIIYYVESIEIHRLSSLSLRLDGRLYVEFLSPVLLSSKIIMYSGGNGVRAELFRIPSPGAIIAYSLKLWNSISPPQYRLPRPCDDETARRYEAIFSVRAEACTGVEMAEIRSVVVETGRRRDGGAKTDTAFEGKIRFKIACEEIEEIASKTLALAQHLGIGRSRGIGLGEIQLTPQPTKTHTKAYKLDKNLEQKSK